MAGPRRWPPRLRLAERQDAATLAGFLRPVHAFDRHAPSSAADIEQPIQIHPPGNIIALTADGETIVGGLLSVCVNSVDEWTHDRLRTLRSHRSDGSLWLVLDELSSPHWPEQTQQYIRDWLLQQMLLRAAATPGVRAVVVPVHCPQPAASSASHTSSLLALQLRHDPRVLRHVERGAKLLPSKRLRRANHDRSGDETVENAGELQPLVVRTRHILPPLRTFPLARNS